MYNTLLHWTALQCTIHYCTEWHYSVQYITALKCNTVYNTLLHWMAQQCKNTLQCTIHYCTEWHYTVQYITALHYTTMYQTSLHCTARHYTINYCTALHCTTQDRPYWSLAGVCRRHCCIHARGNWGRVQGELFRQICPAEIFWFYLGKASIINPSSFYY